VEPLWLAVAFTAGFGARRIGLPPLVGYLIAGFVLYALGAEAGGFIDEVADTGVLLMLFTIGLKLQLRTLLRPSIWATASIHMLVTVVVLGGAVFGLATLGLSAFAGLSLMQAALISFALSFSSTVFAVKVLEDKGEVSSQHGKTAIGILIVQDIVAIVFMTVSKGTLPSPWAIALVVGLVAARPLLGRVMTRCGHGELLLLFGLVLTLAGAASFDLVGLKPDLGALVVGILLAQHARASELAKKLLDFKDLLLVGFFLSVGLTGAPSLTSLAIAALLAVAIPFKSAFFYWLLCRFRLRARNGFLASLSLSNFSEFGLIVAAVAYKEGWLSADWLIILAIAVALTFIAASPLNARSHALFVRFRDHLARFEREDRLPEDAVIDPEEAEVVVLGMGHLGRNAYDTLRTELGETIMGLDRDPGRVAALRKEGYNLIIGDATDLDLYERIERRRHVRVMLLAFDNFQEKLVTVGLLRRFGFGEKIAALARHQDEADELRAAGADAAFNLSDEAGVGFARHALELVDGRPADAPPG
jgi:glutathione-regulated potassium-efflux system ancillary protein KefC